VGDADPFNSEYEPAADETKDGREDEVVGDEDAECR